MAEAKFDINNVDFSSIKARQDQSAISSVTIDEQQSQSTPTVWTMENVNLDQIRAIPSTIADPNELPEVYYEDNYVVDVGNTFLETVTQRGAKRAMQTQAIAAHLGKSEEYVDTNYDQLMREVYGEETIGALDVLEKTAEVGMMVASPIAIGSVALAVGPLTAVGLTGVGLLSYLGIDELNSFIVQKTQGEKYKALQHRSYSELLDDDASELTKDLVEFLEFGGEIVASGAAIKPIASTKVGQRVFAKTFSADQQIANKFMRESHTLYKTPDRVYFTADDIKSIFRNGDRLTKQEQELIALAMDGNAAKYKQAMAEGVEISIPAEKIVTITDKPLWANLKSIMRIKPYSETRVYVDQAGVKSNRPIAGYLEPPQGIGGEKYAKENGRPLKTRSLKERIEGEEAGRIRVRDVTKDGVEAQPTEVTVSPLDELAHITHSKTVPDESMYGKIINDVIRRDADLTETSNAKGIENTIPPIGTKQSNADKLFEASIQSGYQLNPSRTELAAEIPQIKKRIRMLSGQIKISELTDTRKAYEFALKKSQADTRIAYREGRKQGVKQERERILELKREQTARNAILQHTRDMIKDIKSVKGKLRTFSSETQEILNPVFDVFDMARLSEKKTLELKSLKDRIDANPDFKEEISVDVLKQIDRLDKKPLRDLTPDELQFVHDTVMDIANVEIDNRRAFVLGKTTTHEKLISDIITKDLSLAAESLTESASAFVDPGLSKPKRLEAAKKLGKWMFDINLAPDGYFARIFGENSTMYRTFVQSGIEGINTKAAIKQSWDDDLLGRLNTWSTENMINNVPEWLSEPRVFGSYELTRDRYLSLFCHSRLPDNRASLTKGGFGLREDPNRTIYEVPESILEDIATSITQEELSFITDVTDPIFARVGRDIGVKYEDRNFRKFNTIDQYMPKPTMDIALEAEIDAMANYRKIKIGIYDAFTLERTQSTKPLFLDGLSFAISGHMQKTSNWIGMIDYADTVSRVLSDNRFRTSITRELGEDTLLQIERIALDATAGPAPVEAINGITSFMQKYSRNISRAFVTSPLRAAANFAAFPLYGQYVNSPYIMEGVIQVSRNGESLRALLSELSPMYRERARGGINPEIDEIYRGWDYLEQLKGESTDTLRKLIKEEGLSGAIRKESGRDKLISTLYVNSDRNAVAVGMYGAIEQSLAEMAAGTISKQFKDYLAIMDIDPAKLPHQHDKRMKIAVGYAEHATRRTQNMADVFSQTKLMREYGLWGRMFGKFSSQTSRMLNTLLMEMAKAKKSGNYAQVAKWLMLLYVFNAGNEEAVKAARGKLYDRDYEFNVFKAMADQTASMFYFGRDGWFSFESKSQYGTYSGSDISTPGAYVPNAAIDTMVELNKAITSGSAYDREKAGKKALDSSLRAGMVFNGVPVWPYKIVKEALDDD